MILLTSTSDLLQVITSSTLAIAVHASYVDLNAGTVTPGRTNTAIASAATTTVVASPGASTQRTVKFLSLQNTGVSAETVTVQHTDGTTIAKLQSLSLLAGYTLTYDEGAGWTLYDANGNIQTAIGPGRFLKRTVILNGTTTFTTQPGTASIIARMVAGGGAGGGAPAVTGEHGSGGGSGSYAEWQVAASPNTAYTVAVGAGGTGVSAANGNNGGNTTFAIGATTVTCNGGSGGIVGNSATVPRLGGAGGAQGTNGTLNVAGRPGFPGLMSATVGFGGMGGDSALGSGGAPTLFANSVGAAAPLYGGGGGGAATVGAAQLGGAGANGVIVVDEYS